MNILDSLHMKSPPDVSGAEIPEHIKRLAREMSEVETDEATESVILMGTDPSSRHIWNLKNAPILADFMISTFLPDFKRELGPLHFSVSYFLLRVFLNLVAKDRK